MTSQLLIVLMSALGIGLAVNPAIRLKKDQNVLTKNC